jgi:hypothetical protein
MNAANDFSHRLLHLKHEMYPLPSPPDAARRGDNESVASARDFRSGTPSFFARIARLEKLAMAERSETGSTIKMDPLPSTFIR